MGQFAPMCMQPRLTISVSNFVAQMRHGYDTSNPNGLAIWVPEALLPAGVIQLLNKGKENVNIPLVHERPALINLGRACQLEVKGRAGILLVVLKLT